MKYIYLAVPVLLALAEPLYNRMEPSLLGFPFFYWALFAQIPFSVICIYAAYREESK